MRKDNLFTAVSCTLTIIILSLSSTLGEEEKCPNQCSCVGQTISCQRAGLNTVPRFPQIVPGPNGGVLQFLMLSQNPMIRLERGAFRDQQDLIRIEISFSQLVWVSAESFLGIPGLRSLSLRGNRLAYMPRHIFTPIFMLEDLDLSRNQLRSVPLSLEGLVYLKRLSLFGNPLHCPCEMIDFSVLLSYLEPVRSRVTCQSPPEVAHVQLVELGKRIQAVTRDTRLLGYYAVNDTSEREEALRIQPYQPSRRDLIHSWPWPHCPVEDFGGQQPRPIPASFDQNGESEESGANGQSTTLLYAEPGSDTPRWRDRPQNVQVVAGDVTRFICSATGPKDMRISWLLPGNATNFIRLYRRRQILEIYETHDYHAGTYTCVISTRNGYHMSADATLRLVDTLKPRITDAPPADNNPVTRGSDLELRCSSNGRPRPRISWLWQEETLPLHLVTGGRYIVRATTSGLQAMDANHTSIHSTNRFLQASVEATETQSMLLIRNVTERDAHGRYICYSSNRVASARVSTIIRVVTKPMMPDYPAMRTDSMKRNGMTSDPSVSTNRSELGSLTGDALVRHIIEKARVRIDAAIKKTAERLRDPSRRRSSSDVASLFRQPSRAALELARAAEVYEAAIDEVTSILRQRSHLTVNSTNEVDQSTFDEETDPQSREALGVRLSADQLAIISQLSGCQESSSIDPCSHQLCFHLRYRSIDGACNNFNHARWGAALTPFKRLLPPQYENGINTPVGWSPSRSYFGFPKPSARLVSRELLGDATLLTKHVKRLKDLNEWNKQRSDRMDNEDQLNNATAVNDEYREKFHFATQKRRLEEAKKNAMQFEQSGGPLFDEDENNSGMLMQWGQFLDHDLDFTPVDASISRFSDGLNCNETCLNDPPCFPILIPPGDPRIKHRCIGFARSSATCGSGSTSILLGKPHYREQLNQISSFIDASNVYASDELENSQLRELLHDEGKMRMGMPTPSGKRLLPFNIRGQVDCQADPQQDFVPCFKAGDHRSNENLGLLSMHTLWIREHNRLSDGIRSLNPDWSGDRVYQEARKIVGASMQAITYQVWLPEILGPEGIAMMGEYRDYDDRVNPGISNEFATAAMRFGHTLISPILFRLGSDWEPIREGHLQLHQAFFAPDRMLKDGGMDPILRGLLFNGVRDRSRSPPLNVELTERLFSMAHELALDLAALNVQRGRDHGLPSYTEYAYKFCHLGSSSHPDSFEDLAPRISDPRIRERLHKVYGHPGNIDLYTGGILEDLLPGARVGPTFACIIADQFKRLRDGDRFWYEAKGVFTAAQMVEIRRAGSSLSRVICEASDGMTEVPKNAFKRPKNGNDLMSCTKIPKLNLAAWVDCTPTLSDGVRIDVGQVRRRRSVPEEPTCAGKMQKSTEHELLNKISRMENKLEYLTSKLHKMDRRRGSG